jgi:nicotinamidase-related amidase
MSKTGLLIIDIQKDYFPGGKMELDGADAAGDHARQALAAFRAKRLPVFHVKHLSVRPGATYFIPGSPGVEIHPAVAPAAGEPVIEKNFPNSFRGTTLKAELERSGVDSLVVAGMMTHMCVDASVRAAFDDGYRVTLLADACATRAQAWGGESVPAKQVHVAFLAALGAVYANILNTAAFIPTIQE